ncbi:hypothetical protein GF354_00160 [Candidatus Peregrinibacteria bacterium]|nr:hypothetical protein [Candidatus Peregrinibacteria bacterium]
MLKNHQNKKGTVLTEALIAITLLMTASMVMVAIMMNAYSTIRISRAYLTAQNIASEGVEAVKNLRSTNWLSEPNDADCWMRLDPMIECNVGSNYPKIKDGYLAGFNKLSQWRLEEASGKNLLDLENYKKAMENYRLYFDGSFYTHEEVKNGISPYYRSIEFSDVGNGDDYVSFRVIVQWDENGTIRSVVRYITLHNYFNG